MWFPLLNFSHYDVRDNILSRHSIIIPEKLVKYCKEQGYQSVGLCDHSSLAYSVKFYKACKEAKIKPIFGLSVPTELGYVRVFAKNKIGYQSLNKLLSKSIVNKTVKVNEIAELSNNNFLVVIGELESDFINRSKSHDPLEVLKSYHRLFGNNLYLANDIANIHNRKVILDTARQWDVNLNFIDTNSAYYLKKEVAKDQLVPLVLSKNLRLKDIHTEEAKNDPVFYKFIENEDFRILTKEESEGLSSGGFENYIEEFDITGLPGIYKYKCPNGLSSEEYLTQLAREGWKRKFKNWDKKLYGDRIKEELEIIKKYKLSDYFLIVQDYMNFARKKWYCSSGRGSAGGSLLSYLLNITEIDPIPYGLIFSRFINVGRFTETSWSPPDIDSDFPTYARQEVIKYIVDTFGKQHVCGVATFSRMMGRSALSDVLKAHDFDFKESKIITKYVPNESAVADELQEMKKNGISSLVLWSLEHQPELKQWCEYKKGNFDGPLALEFQQAIRLEGVKRFIGQHASAVLLSKNPLDESVPLVYNSHGELIAAMEYPDLESMGLLKLDILGLDLLDKMEHAVKLIKNKKIKKG